MNLTMTRNNILITGTGGCGVGEGLYKSLEPLNKYTLFNCNSSENSLFLFDKPSHSFIVPPAKSHNYCDTIIKICKENNIKNILPGSEPELITLVNNRVQFEKENILIFANTSDVINTFDNKWETFIKLDTLNIRTPDTTINLNDSLFFERNNYPLVVKPIIGNASKNVFTIYSNEELVCITQYMTLKNVPFVIQEYVGIAEEEYTISVLSDFSGDYLGSIVFRRILAGGFSQYVECDLFEEIDKIAQDVALTISSKGPLNIQCRLVNGELCIFEINPRFSGTTPFRTLLGFNEADILLSKVLENKIVFDKENIQTGSFGVRGFEEKVYAKIFKDKVKKYI